MNHARVSSLIHHLRSTIELTINRVPNEQLPVTNIIHEIAFHLCECLQTFNFGIQKNQVDKSILRYFNVFSNKLRTYHQNDSNFNFIYLKDLETILEKLAPEASSPSYMHDHDFPSCARFQLNPHFKLIDQACKLVPSIILS